MFRDKLAGAISRNKSLLCVGLDPYEVPSHLVKDFNRAIVESTSDLVCAFKPNLAIYEALGAEGMDALEDTCRRISDWLPVIGDGKRGDIANCGLAYARRLFEHFNFDAVTANPYMGIEAVEPFLNQPGRGVFVLCRTSNPTASEVQELQVVGGDGVVRPLYMEIARMASAWDKHGNVGFVVGATDATAVRNVRSEHPSALILIPGVGAQGGALQESVKAAADYSGGGFTISVSRSVIYAFGDPTSLTKRDLGTVAAAARTSAIRYREEINEALSLALV